MEAHFSNESDYNFDDSSSNSNTHQLHPRKKKKKTIRLQTYTLEHGENSSTPNQENEMSHHIKKKQA